ncbi:hypothetical protein FE257_008515 [Aspergillus nanangensis]|uniref:P-loop containing nucleoside triphosphate hydrolase protein n=1 Tax=Aspergillus nanangensis TaxID=2582783 RepID=A0AAD4GUL9_ASPNN|nr:hypothetical protein FE257_008515 [Aspergillus nanangensis]
MAPLKIIGAGYGRTGTSSLRKALESLGYSTHHGKLFFENPPVDPEVFTNAYSTGSLPKWDDVFEGYDAAIDWPASLWWKEIMEYYPDSKVILTVRDPKDWYNSVKSTLIDFDLDASTPEQYRPGKQYLRTVIQNGILANFDDEEATIKQFQEHVARVQETVPRDRLLVFRATDGWEPLCRFLGVDTPKDTPFPYEYTRKDFNAQWRPHHQEALKTKMGTEIEICSGMVTSLQQV